MNRLALLSATCLLPIAAAQAAATSPTIADMYRDQNSVSGPFVPGETYTNQITIGSTTLTSLTCPSHTVLYRVTTPTPSTVIEGKPNLVGDCPTGTVTDGGACVEQDADLHRWDLEFDYIGLKAVSGTQVKLSCSVFSSDN